MKTGFPGFSTEAMRFLMALKKNNKREWFQPRKHIYEEQWKAPMAALVTALHSEMAKFAPEYIQDPAKTVSRIYRDTRFSKDKTPYKTYVSAVFRRRGLSKDGSAQFYMHVEQKEIVIAAGVYMPNPDELRAIRGHLAENHVEFEKLCRSAKVRSLLGELKGEQLTRPPKGFPCEGPAADLLRRKQFYFSARLEPELAATPKLFPEILQRLKASMPILEFLNAPLAGLTKADESRFFRELVS